MNTIIADRLFSDPRFRHLTDELGCPLKAMGALVFLWHGTQNLGVSAADLRVIRATVPFGVRGVDRVLRALVVAGWLEDVGDEYRIVGNEHHVHKREKIKEAGREAALKRWSKTDGLPMPNPLPVEMGNPSNEDGSLCSPHLTSPRSHLTSPADEQSALPVGHPEVQFFEAAYRAQFGGGPFTKQERADSAKLIRQCLESGARWQDMIAAYAGPKFKSRDGSFSWLKFNARDVIRAISGAAKGGKSFAEKMAEQDERNARELAEAEANR